jgi:hypothetical protein
MKQIQSSGKRADFVFRAFVQQCLPGVSHKETEFLEVARPEGTFPGPAPTILTTLLGTKIGSFKSTMGKIGFVVSVFSIIF